MRPSAWECSNPMVTIGGLDSPIGPGSTFGAVTIVNTTYREHARRLARAIDNPGGA